ncbi:MAG: UbiX family flavin prenyltransferase [Pseudomonadota bacterium]
MVSDSKSSVWVVGVTGGSGVRYAVRLLQVLPKLVDQVHVVFSEAALRVLNDEEGIAVSSAALNLEKLCGTGADNVTFYNCRDIGARIASGSMLTSGMVVVPCSMATLGALAHGIPSHLVHRAADVTMKEGRPLIIVPRETPLSAIHLENMLKLARCGVKIVPAMPAFYNRPATVEQMVDQFVMKVLDSMGVSHSLGHRWKESK